MLPLLCPLKFRDVPYVNVIDLNGLTFANVTSFFTIQVIATIVFLVVVGRNNRIIIDR